MSTAPTNCAQCGAAFPPVPVGGGASGYAIRPDGKKICYACADKHEREQLKDRSRPFVGYLTVDGQRVTTWTGGHLMNVTSSRPCRLTRASYVHERNGFCSVRARDVHGAEWYGRGSPGIAIKLRALKGQS